jgi:hypothetical protein
MSCTCHHDPIVLRISLPPGASPELSVPLIEAAIRRHLERRAAAWEDDFPRLATFAEKAAEMREAILMGEATCPR